MFDSNESEDFMHAARQLMTPYDGEMFFINSDSLQRDVAACRCVLAGYLCSDGMTTISKYPVKQRPVCIQRSLKTPML